VCALYWDGDVRVKRRTQSSIAVSVDGEQWLLLNCSPDIREQIGRERVLQPARHDVGVRQSPIAAVVLTNADIDHIGGLLSLRERQPFTVWASAAVLAQLRGNPVYSVLDETLVTFWSFAIGESFSPLAGLKVWAFDLPGKVPLYREDAMGHEIRRNGDTIGLHVDEGERRLSYVPGCGAIDAAVLQDLNRTTTLLFDGTLWADDEMITSGTGTKTGRRMGHVPVSGVGNSIKALEALPAIHRYYVHMNNTNPLLIAGSPEQIAAREAGWTVSEDGMEIAL
jgi:pyrroloquinoline quinone biosynthesis protein B